jgi:hypothetical protein
MHTADGRMHLTLSVTPVLPSVYYGIGNFFLAEFCPTAATREKAGATASAWLIRSDRDHP